MFFHAKKAKPLGPSEELGAVVRAAIPQADEETKSIVVAIVGLCGVVAYADRDFSAAEQDHVRQLLTTIEGLSTSEATALVAKLHEHVITISTTETVRHARTLKDLAAHDLRLHVLELLLELAASDHELAQEEVVTLRQITKSLGLDQSDYNQLQQKHKSLLESLR